MFSALGSAHPQQSRQLPPELYNSLVASLYGDPRTLLVGAAGSVGAALVTAWKSAEPLILVCAVVLAAVACARAVDMWAFARQHRPEVLDGIDDAAYVGGKNHDVAPHTCTRGILDAAIDGAHLFSFLQNARFIRADNANAAMAQR